MMYKKTGDTMLSPEDAARYWAEEDNPVIETHIGYELPAPAFMRAHQARISVCQIASFA